MKIRRGLSFELTIFDMRQMMSNFVLVQEIGSFDY